MASSPDGSEKGDRNKVKRGKNLDLQCPPFLVKSFKQEKIKRKEVAIAARKYEAAHQIHRDRSSVKIALRTKAVFEEKYRISDLALKKVGISESF